MPAIHGSARFGIALPPRAFTGSLMVPGLALSCGTASTFNFVADDCPDNIGVVSGIVGLADSLGVVLLPIICGVILDQLQGNPSCFMLLNSTVWV